MNDQQFQLLVKMIESIDTKIDDFKNETNRRFEQIDKRFEQIDKRFEQVDKRFEQIDKRFEQVDHQFDDLKIDIRDIKHDIRNERDKLQEVYEHRERVTVNFTRSWAMASFFIAILSSTVVLAFAKAF